MPLTEAGSYAAALRLIDADGVEVLTMRKLATALDANPMSLYHHVPNKDAVLRGVARRSAPSSAPWRRRTLPGRSASACSPRISGPWRTATPGSWATPEPSGGLHPARRPVLGCARRILDAAGVPHSELPQFTALGGVVITGVVTAELNGAFHRWSSLKPPTVGEDGSPSRPRRRVFRLTLDAIVMAWKANWAPKMSSGRRHWVGQS